MGTVSLLPGRQALAVYLCGDAAGAITGAVLPIDGGWTAK